MPRLARRTAPLVALFILVALAAGPAQAQTPSNTWIATANGTWSTAANWDNGAPASAATTVVQFNNSGSTAYTATQDIAVNFQLNGMIFNSTSSAATTVTNSAGDALTFVANGGTGPFLAQNNTGAATLGNTGTVTFTTGPTFGGGGTGAVTVSSPVVFQGAGLALNGFNTTTLSGGITLPSAALPITGNGIGSVAFTGAAGGSPTSVTINTGATSFDTGFVQFSSATNNFTAAGGIALQSGNLVLGGTGTSSAGPLGAPANVLTISGGALRASAAATLFNPVTLGATDLVYVGTVAGTLNGAVSVTGTAGLQVLGTGGLTVNNTVGVNGPTVVGVLGFGSGGSAANGSTLTVGSTATTTGSLLNTTAITVNTPANSNTPGNLVLTNATAASSSRLAATTPITLNGGRVSYVSASGVNSQAFGAVTANGFGGIGTQTTNAGTALTFNSLALPSNGAFAFRGSIGTGNNSTVTFTNGVSGASLAGLAPAGSGAVPVVPWAPGFFGTGGNTNSLNSLVTTDGTNGVRVLNNATTGNADFAVVGAAGPLVANQNNLVSYSSATNTQPATVPATAVQVNSLVLNISLTGTSPPPATLSGDPNSVLRVFSGAVLTSSSATISVTTLDFGTHAGYLYPSSQMTMNAALTGSAGLVVSGYQAANAGTFLLLNAPNTVTGGLTVNGSVPIQFRDDRSLGAAGGGITLGGGTLQFISGGTFALTRPVFLTPAGGAVSGTGPNAIQSLITVNSSLVSGTGPLALLGGTVALSGTAGGTWSTFVSGGVVQFAAENNFGSGPITLNGGTLQPTTAATFTRALRVNTSSTIDVGSLSLSFSGPISTLGYTAAAGTPPTLTKAGTGTLMLSADSPFSGPITISAGALRLQGTTGRLTNATIATTNLGGFLILDNSSGNSHRFSGPVTIAGGSLLLIGSASGTSESIGTLSSTAAGGIVSLAPFNTNMPATQLTAANIQVAPTASLLVRGPGLGGTGTNTTRLMAATPPALVNGIMQGVVGDTDNVNGGGSFLVTHSPTNGVVVATLTPSGSTIRNAAPTNTPTTANLLAGVSVTVQDPANTINSLTLQPGTTLNSSAATTLTVTTGMFVVQSGGGLPSTVAANVTLASPATAALTITTEGDLTLAAPPSSGNGAVTKLGNGTLTLAGGGAFSSTLFVVAGPLAVAADTSAGGLGGHGLGTNASVSVAAGVTLSLTGAGSTFFGTLTGPGNLVRTADATGTQVFAGPITLTGTIQAQAGTLSLRSDVPAAATPISIDAGINASLAAVAASLEVAPGVTISRGIDFTSNLSLNHTLQTTTNVAGQAAVTLAGPVNAAGNLSMPTNNATYNVTGVLSGGGNITLGGGASGAGGTLNLLNPNNSFFGTITLLAQAGTTSFNTVLGVGAAGAAGTGSLILSAGGLSNTAPLGGGYLQALGGPQTLANPVSAGATGPGGTILGLVGTNPLTLTSLDVSSATLIIDNRSSNGSALSIGTVTENGGAAAGNVVVGTLLTPATNVVRVTTALTNGGSTTVTGGVLQVNGTSTVAGQLTVGPGGTLGGTGTINRSTDVAGTIAPGTSVGTLHFGAPLALDPGGKYQFEYAAVTGLNPGVNYDTIANDTILTLGALSPTTAPFTVVITPVGNLGTTGAPVTYVLGTFTQGVSGFDPATFAFAGTFTGTPSVSLDASQTQLLLTFTPVPVPEPGCVLLAASAAAAGWAWRRRRRAAAASV